MFWSLASAPAPAGAGGAADAELRSLVHRTIRGVTQDLETFRFNTMVSKLMILRNELKRVRDAGTVEHGCLGRGDRYAAGAAAPAFPHLAEELWTDVRGRPYSVHQQPWPEYDESCWRRSRSR